MPSYQLRFEIFSKAYSDLTEHEREFITYFLRAKMDSISSVIESTYTTAPQGYGSSIVLNRIIKIKERIFTDKELSDKLKRSELYRIVPKLDDHGVPSYNSYNVLIKRLGVEAIGRSTQIWSEWPIHWVSSTQLSTDSPRTGEKAS